ncbi:carbohydrate kinase family protein [Tropicimonas sp. S265A]|uniref:carbohydrate kinase family protein n=1 Tax=Tropicimonas sp. S265A TaxID=3415134 RepID=UPI003C7CE4E0
MIICAGEALIDMLPRALGDSTGFLPVPGGSVFNTAIALGRLDTDVGMVTGLSRDMFGDLLLSGLVASGVDAADTVFSDRPTTLAFVTLVDGQARYAFYDENTAGRMLQPGDMPNLPEDARAVFVGGISLAVEPCAAAYEAMVARAGDRVVMLDPNIRPDFIADEAIFRARMDRLLARADLVKASDEDLAWLTGASDVDLGAADLLGRGAKVVLITEGADGARAITARGTVSVPGHVVEVADTVGAGDTFNAGVLAALDRAGLLSRGALADISDDALTAALNLGVQAAAVTVSRAGANPPWSDEL